RQFAGSVRVQIKSVRTGMAAALRQVPTISRSRSSLLLFRRNRETQIKIYAGAFSRPFERCPCENQDARSDFTIAFGARTALPTGCGPPRVAFSVAAQGQSGAGTPRTSRAYIIEPSRRARGTRSQMRRTPGSQPRMSASL